MSKDKVHYEPAAESDSDCEVRIHACLAKASLDDLRSATGGKPHTAEVLHFDRGDLQLSNERASLHKALGGSFDQMGFEKLTTALEARAALVGLSPTQVEKTYSQLTRIAEKKGDGPVSAGNRKLLIQQFMTHLGEDAPVLSGGADTCDWGVLAYRMMRKEPEVLAKMVADLVITSGFTMPNGRHIHIDNKSLQPDENARKNSPVLRDYFSQVATVGLNSVKWSTQSVDPTGAAVKRGALHFQQLPKFSGHDLGERVWKSEQGKLVVFGSQKRGSVGGIAYLDDIQRVETLLTGRKHSDYAVFLKEPNTTGRNEVSSPAEMVTALKAMKDNGVLPAVVQAYADKSPVREIYLKGSPHEPKAPDTFHGLAVVDVKDVEGKARATVYNPWGVVSEVSVDTLFDALSAKPKTP